MARRDVQTLKAAANRAVTLSLVTDQTYSCARDFVIPALGYYELLPDTGTVQVAIPAQRPGSRLEPGSSPGAH